MRQQKQSVRMKFVNRGLLRLDNDVGMDSGEDQLSQSCWRFVSVVRRADELSFGLKNAIGTLYGPAPQFQIHQATGEGIFGPRLVGTSYLALSSLSSTRYCEVMGTMDDRYSQAMRKGGGKNILNR